MVTLISEGVTTNVYLGRLQGVAGFEKQLVIKRIGAEHAARPEVLRRFLDEGRVAAHLSHPHIVQVFDVGEDEFEGNLPYIAMEYVRGVPLSLVIHRARAAQRIDTGHAAQLIAGIAGALGHAHEAVDDIGRPLNLVHRDVSPANVMVSQEGIAKLIDFGLATTKEVFTPAQAVQIWKGDLRHLAPEQLTGPVDARADVYSLGVLLYELTTGEHPLGPPGQDLVEIRARHAAGFTPPAVLVPDYPPLLQDIVMSALELDPARRCPSANLMRERLEAFAVSVEHTSNPGALSAWLRQLFPHFVVAKPADFSEPTAPTAPAGRIEPARPAPAAKSAWVDQRREADSSRSVLATERTVTAPARDRTRLWQGLAVAATGLAVVITLLESRLRERFATPAPTPAPLPAPPPVPPEPPAPEAVAVVREPGPAPADPAKTEQAGEERAVATAVMPAGGGMASQRRAGRTRRSELPVSGSRVRLAGEARRGRRAIAAAGAPSPGSPLAAPTDPFAAARREPAATIVDPAPPQMNRWNAVGPADVAKAPAALPPPAPAALPPPAPPPPPPRPTPSPVASAQELAPPLRGATGATMSALPKSPVPVPTLPRIFTAREDGDLLRACRAVESALVNRAGVSPEFAAGVTAPMRGRVGVGKPIYPIAMYYFVVREAALRHDNVTAGSNLAAAHASGAILQLKDSPGIEPSM